MRDGWTAMKAGRGAAAAMLGVLALAIAGGGCGLLKKKKAFGEACAQAEDCESLECASVGSICSKTCTFDKECGDGLVCRAKDDGTGNVCSKSQGSAPNASCMLPSECDHGHCLKRVGQQDQPGICSMHCQTTDECPAGMKVCEAISDSEGVKFCLPGGDTGTKPKFTAPKPKPTAKPTATATATAAPTATATATATATTSATATPTATPDAGAGDGGLGKLRIVPTATPK